jgi:hypothetical protein
MATRGEVTRDFDTDKIYQRIGEFVVCYQWIESKFRQIGWLILDPTRTEWPPKHLRSESNKELIDKVKDMYLNLIDRLDHIDAKHRSDLKHDFVVLAAHCHELRKYRNDLLHSAFIELKGGGEVVGILRSDPKVKVDQSSGELLVDQQDLTEQAILKQLQRLGSLAFPLGQHYLQLLHWAPFDSAQRKDAVRSAIL